MATTALPEGTEGVGLHHGGRERMYFVHVPASGRARPSAAGLAPLVLQLHGRGVPPLLFDRWTGFSALADEAGFVLAMPAAVGEIWNDGRYGGGGRTGRQGVDDVGFLLAVVDELIGRGGIDPARVYVVGMSNGAGMAGRLAWERPERVAAIAQVAGTVAAAVAAGPPPDLPVAVLHVHGTRDRSMPYAGGTARPGVMRLLLGRPAGPALGVDEWANRWVAANGAAAGPAIESIPPDVTVRRWSGPTPESDIAFYRVEGGGHTWPTTRTWVPPHLGRMTRTIDATRLSWAFFAGRRREG